MIPHGAETLEAFLRWMNEGGPIRAPNLYGGKLDGAPAAEAKPKPPEAKPEPTATAVQLIYQAQVDRKSMAAGDDCDAAEVIEDKQEEDAP